MKRLPETFSNLGASNLFMDYIRQKQITDFYDVHRPVSQRSFELKARDFEHAPVLSREQLSDMLMSFNADFNPSRQSIESILALKSPDTFTLTTGQQLSLFGGPAYTIYKILTVIGLARHLSQTTDMRVLPVFWLADEDHDFAEVREFKFPGDDATGRSISVDAEAGHLGRAMGQHKISESAEQAVSYIYEQAGPQRISKLTKRLLSFWQPGTSWRTAFARGIIELFGEYGLILAGSDQPEIKQQSAAIWHHALLHQAGITEAITRQSAALEERGYHTQVAINDSCLFFHHEQHGRIKLPFENGKWHFPDAEPMSPEAAVEHVKQKNLYSRLSPNVFLRPILQQYLLPNIGYAGGPAEVAYHAQMKPVFEHFGLPMPVILSRFSATIVEPSIVRAASALPFELGDYQQPHHVLVKKYLNERAAINPEGFFEEWRQDGRQLMQQRISTLAELHDSLETSVRSTQQRMEHHLTELEKKVRTHLKDQESVQINRIKRVQQHLFPEQSLQEREYGWLYFINAYGTSWMDDILADFEQKPFLLLQKHHYIFL